MLDLKGSDAAGSIPDASMSLQLGREGRPFESWPLVLAPGQHSLRDFDVPLDAEFVGFRASRQAEQAIAELRVSPRSVVETRKRVPAGTVLSAAAFAPVRIFFHDSLAYPEAEGFWVGGRTTVRMTMLKVRETDPGVLLAVHSGARPNVVTLATPDWSQKLELVPGITARVTVPSKAGERVYCTDDLDHRRLRSRRDRTEPRSQTARRVDRVYPRRYRQNVRSPLIQSFAPIFFPSSRLRGKY